MPPAAPAASRDRIAFLGAILTLLVHAAFAGRYDFFRDELYFIVCGQHPGFGYADQPPLVPLLAAAAYALDWGVWPLRLPGAFASAALVFLGARFARLLGGSGMAAALAAFACAVSPFLVGSTIILSTSSFEPLSWTLVAFLLAHHLRGGSGAPDLLLAGLVAGVTLEMKYSLLFWLTGIAVGLLAGRERRLFLERHLWLAAALAAALALPSVIWQALNGFPFLELGRSAAAKNADTALLPFLEQQVLATNPALVPLWLAGLVAPFASKRLADMRFVPIACLVVFAIVRAGSGKDYYLAPIYPSLFAIGAAWLLPGSAARWRKAAAATLSVAAAAISVIIAPLVLPILSPQRLAEHMAATGIAPQQQERNFAGTALPQHFADQFGWRDFANQVEAAWERIPQAERAKTAIKTDNYGEAAALDLFGSGLPQTLSGHNQYGLWGTRGQHPANLLVVTSDPDTLKPFCRSLTILGTTDLHFAMAYENGKALVLCSGLTIPLADLWPNIVHIE